MKKIAKVLFAITLISSLASCKKGNTKLSYRELDSKVNDYYSQVSMTVTGDSFINSLTKTISKDYTKSDYKTAWTILAKADQDPYNSNNVICSYTGLSMVSSEHTLWNREHTWAKSHGFNKDSMEAYTDCHHLTATAQSINSKRGDLDFGEVENFDGTVEEDSYGNKWISGKIFEPRDEVKGDVARKLFYMVARYNDSNLDLTLVDKITDGTSPEEGKGSLGFLSTLIKWHYEDPVDFFEINRNEVVYSYQNNRNPFIDHPEWVNKAFPSKYAEVKASSTKVNKAISLIKALPEEVTLDDLDKVEKAKEYVDNLNAQEKLYVTNYSKLSKCVYEIKYLKNNSTNDGGIIYDLKTASPSTSGYVDGAAFTVGDSSFYAAPLWINGSDFRVGTNGNKVSDIDLATLGFSGLSGKGAYLKTEFSVTNLKKIKLDYVNTSGKIDKVYAFVVVNNQISEIKETTLSVSPLEITFDNKQNGELYLAFAGTNPRIYISQLVLFNE